MQSLANYMIGDHYATAALCYPMRDRNVYGIKNSYVADTSILGELAMQGKRLNILRYYIYLVIERKKEGV